jgi:hypothetical protein
VYQHVYQIPDKLQNSVKSDFKANSSYYQKRKTYLTQVEFHQYHPKSSNSSDQVSQPTIS